MALLLLSESCLSARAHCRLAVTVTPLLLPPTVTLACRQVGLWITGIRDSHLPAGPAAGQPRRAGRPRLTTWSTSRE